MAYSLRTARRACFRVAEQLRGLEQRVEAIRAAVPLPKWPREVDYDEQIARDPAMALAHDLEHVSAATCTDLLDRACAAVALLLATAQELSTPIVSAA